MASESQNPQPKKAQTPPTQPASTQPQPSKSILTTTKDKLKGFGSGLKKVLKKQPKASSKANGGEEDQGGSNDDENQGGAGGAGQGGSSGAMIQGASDGDGTQGGSNGDGAQDKSNEDTEDKSNEDTKGKGKAKDDTKGKAEGGDDEGGTAARPSKSSSERARDNLNLAGPSRNGGMEREDENLLPRSRSNSPKPKAIAPAHPWAPRWQPSR